MAKETKTSILNAAETLFAQQGYAHTSMRTITTYADVNLASVNYHFGSKKNLIQQVLKRYFDILMPQFDEVLHQFEVEKGAKGIESLFLSLVSPMMTLSQVRPNGTELFVQLLGRGYTETQGHLRRFIMTSYGATVANLIATIRRCLPDVNEDELFWRMHFALGSFVFSMASSEALTEIAQADFDEQVDIKAVIMHMVPFVSYGIAGPK
ncbi:TetR/AcrR family transcriptional regulator [Alteromonas sp. C1M14]|uniref:TetR/AcrR family transcriptional regulator n=1 Tax=Alteromonas sp. C1M14 TaxID=2841567 RepID=UPI001C09A6F2|nr:TetR/AcrR family transcriptional regulator [Alteromonas sp. C1M14]MBU2976954.1 TetR family transcriptional regulator [Alteromonas sp. C1M14]